MMLDLRIAFVVGLLIGIVIGVVGCALFMLKSIIGEKTMQKVKHGYNLRHYSVYHQKTDKPLIIYATAKECAAAMGITKKSFYRYVMRMREGKIRLRKWAVYTDLEDEYG